MPSEAREELWSQLAPYRQGYPQPRWLRPENWHLTLVFLGNVRGHRARELVPVIDEVALRRRPVRAAVARAGGRVSNKDGVAWLGLEAGAGDVIETAEVVAAACPADITMGAPPKRTPAAHLTIARRADRELIAALETRSLGSLDAAWTIDRIALVRSHLGPGRSRYETLHEVTL